MTPPPYVLVSDNEWNEREFVLLQKEQYVHNHSTARLSENNRPDVVKLDFERLADFIRFEALKKKKLLTIDRIKEILDVKC
jgi:hypothetical protein